MTITKAGLGVEDELVAEQVDIQAKYSGYIERQQDEVARRAEHDSLAIPARFDYGRVRGLSNEVRHKFEQHRPQTVGQAGRISGITPAAIALLLVHLRKEKGAGAFKKTA